MIGPSSPLVPASPLSPFCPASPLSPLAPPDPDPEPAVLWVVPSPKVIEPTVSVSLFGLYVKDELYNAFL